MSEQPTNADLLACLRKCIPGKAVHLPVMGGEPIDVLELLGKRIEILEAALLEACVGAIQKSHARLGWSPEGLARSLKATAREELS